VTAAAAASAAVMGAAAAATASGAAAPRARRVAYSDESRTRSTPFWARLEEEEGEEERIGLRRRKRELGLRSSSMAL